MFGRQWTKFRRKTRSFVLQLNGMTPSSAWNFKLHYFLLNASGSRSERRNESAKASKTRVQKITISTILTPSPLDQVSLLYSWVIRPGIRQGSTNFGALVKIYFGALVLMLWTSSEQVWDPDMGSFRNYISIIWIKLWLSLPPPKYQNPPLVVLHNLKKALKFQHSKMVIV